MTFLGFDPGAELRTGLYGLDGRAQLVEARLERSDDDRLHLTIEISDDAEPIELILRADFLEALIAARAREAAA